MIALLSAFILCMIHPFGYDGGMRPGLSLARSSIKRTERSLNSFGAPIAFSAGTENRPRLIPLTEKREPTNITRIVNQQAIKSWSGWNNINYIFSFGDSYTSTNFQPTGTPPNANNSFGNPPYPGGTSSNGPNYIDFLTNIYNDSRIQTYNLAYGGATVNPFLVPTLYGAAVKTFLSQVMQEFLPIYTNTTEVPWKSSDTLFTIFFGINDCIQSYPKGNDSLNYDIIKSYEGLVDQLYTAGARNFLFLNVPPVDRSPGQLEGSQAAQKALADYIGTFNFRLGELVSNLAQTYPEITTFSFDTNYFFTAVLDNSTSFPQTANYLNTTNYCAAYMGYAFSSYYDGDSISATSGLQAALTNVDGTPTLSYFYPPCGIPIEEYLWLNSLHPTYGMHEFMASLIAQQLEGY